MMRFVKTYLLAVVGLLLMAPVYGQGEKKEGVEKYSWTLGYEPDKVINFYEPVPDEKLKLNLFLPEDYKVSDKRPCVIFFFGGGWRSGDPSQFYGISKYLASRGVLAISAQYRTRKQKGTPRNCVEDGREAIRYVREHADELGVDADRIAIGGGSAGGHVAAAVAMCPKMDANPRSKVSSVPNALLLFNPVYNNGPGEFGHASVKDYWKDISPYHNIVEGLPATIVFFGSRDKHVSEETMNGFQEAMEKAGNSSVSHIYKDQSHGFFHISKGGRVMFEDVLTKVDGFLVKEGFLRGEDNVKAWTEQAIEHCKKVIPEKGTEGRKQK